MENKKQNRILDMYSSLVNGNVLSTAYYADKYAVDERTIARDIRDLRDFIAQNNAERGLNYQLDYIAELKGYKLVSANSLQLSDSEIYALCKILLASKAFTNETMHTIIDKLVNSIGISDNIRFIKKLLANELHHYIEPAHKDEFITKMWTLTKAIDESSCIDVDYFRMQDKKLVKRKLKPLAMMFSEYYFYLIAYIDDSDLTIDKIKPIIYRLDRIKRLEVLEEKFRVPYSNRFEEGEFRKRIQFMQGGELKTVEFIFRGESIEAVRDRLPNADIKELDNGEYLVRAKLYGRGIDMWLGSQGERVEIVE